MVNEVVELEEVETVYKLSGKTYLLYIDKEQTKLLAMAYDEEQIKTESQYFTNGVWFEYDNIADTILIINERQYKKKITFPDLPLERPKIKEHKDNTTWIR